MFVMHALEFYSAFCTLLVDKLDCFSFYQCIDFEETTQKVLITPFHVLTIPGALQKWWHLEISSGSFEAAIAASIFEFQTSQCNLLSL